MKKTRLHPIKSKRMTAFLKVFEKTNNISASCKAIKVSRNAYYLWLKQFPKFSQAVYELREAQLDEVEDKLMELIRDGNDKAVTFYLSTKGRDRGYGKSGLKYVSAKEKEILTSFKNGDIDIQEVVTTYALYGFPIPDGIKALISRIQIPEALVVETVPFTDEELEDEYRQALAENEQQQKAWLPKRKGKIAEAKKEVELSESGKIAVDITK